MIISSQNDCINDSDDVHVRTCEDNDRERQREGSIVEAAMSRVE